MIAGIREGKSETSRPASPKRQISKAIPISPRSSDSGGEILIIILYHYSIYIIPTLLDYKVLLHGTTALGKEGFLIRLPDSCNSHVLGQAVGVCSGTKTFFFVVSQMLNIS